MISRPYFCFYLSKIFQAVLALAEPRCITKLTYMNEFLGGRNIKVFSKFTNVPDSNIGSLHALLFINMLLHIERFLSVIIPRSRTSNFAIIHLPSETDVR